MSTVAEDEVGIIRASVIRTRMQLVNLLSDAFTEAVDARVKDVEGGKWDGVPVVTQKDLTEIMAAVFGQKIPPPDAHMAEIATPASVACSVVCPSCDIPQLVLVALRAELVTDDDGSELKVKAKAKGVAHTCGQLSLDGELRDADQVTVEQSIENLRLRMLRVVQTAHTAWDGPQEEGNEAPPPTLDAVARLLELSSENERADLEDALYHLAGLTPPLVTIVPYAKKTTIPTHYVLTDAGAEYIAAAEAEDEDVVDDTDMEADGA